MHCWYSTCQCLFWELGGALKRIKEYIRPFYLRFIYSWMCPKRYPFHPEDYWGQPYNRLPLRSSGVFSRATAIVLYPMNDWHGRMQRTQHLARSLAQRGYVVIYVNPHLGRQFETGPWDRTPRLSRLDDNLFELHIRLPREPVFHERTLSATESRTIARVVEVALDDLGASAAVQVLSLPIWLEAAMKLRQTRGWPIVYDCHDLLRGLNIAGEIVALEPKALREADLTLFSSGGLLDEQLTAGTVPPENARMLRNAVDADYFCVANGEGTARAVYVGAVESWFDVASVRAAALRNPNCRFRIAGRVDAPYVRRGLDRIQNLELLGEVAYDRVPELLEARVGLIPFLVNDLTLAANPIKLYEYFAAGLPVVSPALPEVQAFQDLVYVAGSPEEFAAAVQRAIAENDPRLRQRRRQIAETESWKARAAVLADEFDELLGCRLSGPQSHTSDY
jgi:glycosyltransferase involved in cell wall biosynthesis